MFPKKIRKAIYKIHVIGSTKNPIRETVKNKGILSVDVLIQKIMFLALTNEKLSKIKAYLNFMLEILLSSFAFIIHIKIKINFPIIQCSKKFHFHDSKSTAKSLSVVNP